MRTDVRFCAASIVLTAFCETGRSTFHIRRGWSCCVQVRRWFSLTAIRESGPSLAFSRLGLVFESVVVLVQVGLTYARLKLHLSEHTLVWRGSLSAGDGRSRRAHSRPLAVT